LGVSSSSHLALNGSDGRAVALRYGQPRTGADEIGATHSARNASISQRQQASPTPSAARDADPSPSPREGDDLPSPRSAAVVAADGEEEQEHYVYTAQ
jgi:hypothetical protein